MLHMPTPPSTCRRFCLLLLLLAALLPACTRSTAPTDPEYVDAVELKLKCRELADQMLATMPNDALKGVVALPTSFVEQGNRSVSSPLGRLISEALIYEFNQRGFPVREYRLAGKISVTGGRDDLAFLNNVSIPVGQKWAALIVGTYYVDKDAKREEQKVEKVIAELYERMLEDPGLLPDGFLQIAYQEGADRAVTDYISGMSDEFAIHMFEDLFVPKKWHVL